MKSTPGLANFYPSKENTISIKVALAGFTRVKSAEKTALAIIFITRYTA
jgi:hypothetical protein